MSHRSAILAAVSAFALIGGGSALAADPATMPVPPASNPAGDVANPPPISDPATDMTTPTANPVKVDLQTFTTKAAISDLYEVKAAELALERSSSAEVKDFATMMKEAHTQTSATLAPLAKTAGAEVPTEPDQEHMDKLKALTDSADTAFDQTYIDQQVAAHQAALALFTSYATMGDNEQVVAFAKETAPKIEEHLKHAQEIQKSLADRNAPAN